MSGVKQVSFEEEQRRRAEAMRAAALSAARADRERVERTLGAAVPVDAPRELRELAARLRREALRSTGGDEIESLRVGTGALGATLPPLARAVATLASLDPRRHAATRAEALRLLQRCDGVDDVHATLRGLSARSTADEQEDVHRRAMALWQELERCLEAGVALTPTQREVAEILSRYALSPALDEASAALEQAVQRVSADLLRAQLATRQRLLSECVETLLSPPWRERLSEWRPTLPDALARARDQIASGDWRGWRSIENEIDELLWARARLRMSRVLDAARAAGLDVHEGSEDVANRALNAEVRTKGALVALVREEAIRLESLGRPERTRVEGPQNLSAEQCGNLWLNKVFQEAERTGAQATLYVHGEPARETTTAAQQRQRVASRAVESA